MRCFLSQRFPLARTCIKSRTQSHTTTHLAALDRYTLKEPNFSSMLKQGETKSTITTGVEIMPALAVSDSWLKIFIGSQRFLRRMPALVVKWTKSIKGFAVWNNNSGTTRLWPKSLRGRKVRSKVAYQYTCGCSPLQEIMQSLSFVTFTHLIRSSLCGASEKYEELLEVTKTSQSTNSSGRCPSATFSSGAR